MIAFVSLLGAAPGFAAPASARTATRAVTTPALLSPISASATQSAQTVHPGDAPITVYTLKLVNNNLIGTEHVTSVTFENRNSGGTNAQKDAAWQRLSLSYGNTVLATASFSGNRLTFSGLDIPIGPLGGAVNLVIAGNASVLAKDGDKLDLRIGNDADIVLSGGTSVKASSSLDPGGDFTIDGMTAAQITLAPVTTPYFPIGATRQLALAVRIPPNGYAPDALKQLELVNLGTATGSDIAKLEAWRDDGDGVWEADQDTPIGAGPAFTGLRWVLGGINETVAAPSGQWLFVTVDVADQATPDATIQLALPVSAPGLQMGSNNDGPNDRQVANPVAHVISLVDRVVVTPLTFPSGTARPDSARMPLLGMVLSNTYADDRTLTGLMFTNTTTGPGAIPERDAEFARVELRADGNDDGVIGDFAADPILGTAVFTNGRALFSGIDLDLPAGKSRRVFITGDASLLRASDGDVLSGAITVREDFQFKGGATAVSGSFPLASGNGWTIDGMVAAQIDNGGAPPVTLGPDGGPAEALDVTVRRNGYQDDVLQSFSVVNLGDASPADLAGLRLWRDGGNGTFDAGAGDDSDLGPLTESGGVWNSAALSLPLGAAGQRLFVAATAAAAPADSVTIRLAIPTGGLATASGNDGPLDVAVANAEAIRLANGGLIASLAFDEIVATVGQNVTLRMAVHNTAAESVLTVAPTVPLPSGTAVLTPLSGPTPASLDLPPGGNGEFQWTLRADGAGVDRSTARASGTGSPSGDMFSSFDAESGELRVLAPADTVQLSVANAMPQAVSRGQSGVLPLYLTFQHPEPDGSPVDVTRLRVRIEREDGSDVIPASLLSRALMIADGETLQVVTPAASGANLVFDLPAPVRVSGPDATTLALALDISASTAVPDFRLVLTDTGAVHAVDAPTGSPVFPALTGTTWPVATGLARVQSAPLGLDVAADTLAPARAGLGQNDVVIARLSWFNPGTTGVTSDVRVGALDLKLADADGVRIAKPGSILERLKLRSGPLTYADRAIAPLADSVMTLTLSPLLAVPVNTPTEVLLVADVADAARLGAFHIEIGDSARFDARDPNSGNHVPVQFATHPVAGPAITVEDRADTVFATGIPHLPPTVGVAAHGVQAISVVLRHPGTPGTGRLRVDSLTVRCIDETGASLVPATFVDRMDVLWNGTPVSAVPDPPVAGSTMIATLPGPLLAPGDTARITLLLDFQASAPPSTFALAINANGLVIKDANLDARATAVVENGGEFPLLSGITRLVPPSRTLLTDLTDAMPAVVAADGLEQTAGTLVLTNPAATGSGPIRIGSLRLRARDASQAVALGAAVGWVSVAIGGTTFASSATLTSDSTTATLTFPTELSVEPGAPTRLDVRFATRLDPVATRFALALDASDIGIVQPGNPLLDVAVLPAPGRAFPLATATASYASASLAGSWSNFPNPFSPTRGGTRFTYYLPAPARVTLELWTGRGERVAVVIDNADRAAGLHQDDLWDGRNGAGSTVQNGVYLATLTVEMAGRTERLKRKVAVVR